jgi:taurine dioxygenase
MPTFGVEVSGLDLASELDGDTIGDLRLLLAEHGIILFRRQMLSPQQQGAFMRRFGDLLVSAREEFNHREEPAVALLGNATENGRSIAFMNEVGIEWHVDGTGRPFEQLYTALYAVRTPRRGGDTLYTSGRSGAAMLPERLRRAVEGRRAVYNYTKIHAKLTNASQNGIHLAPEVRAAQPDSHHLILRPHPLTGQESVYLTPEELIYIEGYSPEESRAIAHEIIHCITAPDCVYVHHWQPCDLVLHDNSASLHSTTEYTYRDEVRLMHRVIAYQVKCRPVAIREAANAD